MAEKKASTLENAVWSCVGVGAAAFLGAVFGGAAEALASLAEYAFSSGAKEFLETAQIGLACTGGAVGAGTFAGLYAWRSYASKNDEAVVSSEISRDSLHGSHGSCSISDCPEPDDLMQSPMSATGSKYISTREYSGR